MELTASVPTQPMPQERPTPEMVERFAEMGVDRLVLLPNGKTVDEIASFFDHIGETLPT